MDEQSTKKSDENILSKISEGATNVLKYIQDNLCIIYTRINLRDYICDKPNIAILVTLILFILLFTIICLICCKCCCKKKESEQLSLDNDQFIMDPYGQMYNAMYQGQMMQPQMIPTGMMYPQMVHGAMMTPQMFEA